jgi:hypothetical protein
MPVWPELTPTTPRPFVPGTAVFGGASDNGRAVVGVANKATAVEGNSRDGAGVWGSSTNAEGIHAETNSPAMAAIAGFNNNLTGCPCRNSDPDIMVMQSAEDRQRKNVPGGMDGSRHR